MSYWVFAYIRVIKVPNARAALFLNISLDVSAKHLANVR